MDGDRLAIAGVLVGKRGGRACRQRFAANQAGDAALVDGGRRVAIVLFVVHRQVSPGQRLGRDGAGNVGRRGHRIVAGQAAAVKQRADRHPHHLAGAGVVVGIRTGRGTQAQRFAADQASQGAAGQGGGGAAVILPGGGGQARQGQRFRRDGAGQPVRRDNIVAAGAAGGDRRDGLAGTCVLGVEGARVEREVAAVLQQHAGQRAAGQRGGRGAVIVAADHRRAAQGRGALVDGQGGGVGTDGVTMLA